jgi:hypothetical protein
LNRSLQLFKSFVSACQHYLSESVDHIVLGKFFKEYTGNIMDVFIKKSHHISLDCKFVRSGHMVTTDQ